MYEKMRSIGCIIKTFSIMIFSIILKIEKYFLYLCRRETDLNKYVCCVVFCVVLCMWYFVWLNIYTFGGKDKIHKDKYIYFFINIKFMFLRTIKIFFMQYNVLWNVIYIWYCNTLLYITIYNSNLTSAWLINWNIGIILLHITRGKILFAVQISKNF